MEAPEEVNTDPDALLEQLHSTSEKIMSIGTTNDRSDRKTIKDIMERFLVISKDVVAQLKLLETVYAIDRDNARIRICNSVAVKHGREIQAPLDRVTFGQTMQDFPKTLEELRSITQEKRVALLANFDVDEREALEMGEEAGMLALEVWSGCTVSLDG